MLKELFFLVTLLVLFSDARPKPKDTVELSGEVNDVTFPNAP